MILHITQQENEQLRYLQDSLKQQNYPVTHTEYIHSKTNKNTAVKKYIKNLKEDDIVIADGLGLVGNSLYSVLKNIVAINSKRAKVYLIEENLYFEFGSEIFLILGKFLGFERCSLEQKAKTAEQTRKKKGVKLGRKKGQKVTSIFDKHRAKIKRFYALGLSKKKIIEHIGVGTPQSLGIYITRTELEKEQKQDMEQKASKDNFSKAYGLGIKHMNQKKSNNKPNSTSKKLSDLSDVDFVQPT